MNIAVFASTRGTVFQAVIDELEAGRLPDVQIRFLLTNKAHCGAAEKAEKHGIPVVYLNPKGKIREEYDREIMEICERENIGLICLIGWMRILSADFVKKYHRRILNVHPSLLPKYAGGMDTNVHEEVLKNHEKETGMTIHYVDENVDSGEILLQKPIPVLVDDTADTLKERVQELEKKWYPEAIRMVQSAL